MEELNSSNENNRKIRPFGNPLNWHTSQTQLPDTASSSSSSTGQGLTEFENENFSLEIMICGHAELPTEIIHQYGAEEIKQFYPEIETCVFSYAPVGDCAYFWGITEYNYRKHIIQQLSSLPQEVKHIDYETLGEIITRAEKLTSGKTYVETYDKKRQEYQLHKAHTLSCGKKQFEKSFDFFGEKVVDSNAMFGIFILKFVRFRSGYAFYPHTNLLGMDIFINYMIQKYGKHIIPIRDNSKDGFEVLDNNSEKTHIRLSEIVSFFKDIDTSNEISTLNIVDLTCSVISEGTEEYYTRLSRRLARAAYHGADSENRIKFGGKRINLRYLPQGVTRKDKKQINMLIKLKKNKKSKKIHKKGHYYTRKKNKTRNKSRKKL